MVTMLVVLSLAAAAVSALTDNPLVNAHRITACILKLADDIAPYIALAFILMGGITYISGADNTKQMLMGKKYATFGVVGLICVKVLVALAAMPPFEITPDDCVNISAVDDPLAYGFPNRYLVNPGDGDTLGTNLLLPLTHALKQQINTLPT